MKIYLGLKISTGRTQQVLNIIMLGISFSITRQAKIIFSPEALAATDFINILLNRFFPHHINIPHIPHRLTGPAVYS